MTHEEKLLKRREYYQNNREKKLKQKNDSIKKIMGENPNYSKERYWKNREKNLEKNKKSYKKNKEKHLKRMSEYSKKKRLENYSEEREKKNNYYLLNKERINRNRSEAIKKRKEKDPLYKISFAIRRRVSQSIRIGGFTKKSKTYQILGCTFEEFKLYIENKFIDGMSWENYGYWHLDHIIPISSATDELHLIKLNHYSNFQPLWKSDNLRKGDKIS